jgi:hypothetical protein
MSNEILKEFQIESKNLIEQMTRILESCEGNFSQVKRLEDYGQTVDRIMGGAKSLATVMDDPQHMIHKIGDYAALCKAVGYKASQIKDNPQFYDICVAFLLDATEMLTDMLGKNFETTKNFKELFSKTFLDRLRWLSDQFGEEFKATLEIHKSKPQKMTQEEIDQLLKKLGLD